MKGWVAHVPLRFRVERIVTTLAAKLISFAERTRYPFLHGLQAKLTLMMSLLLSVSLIFMGVQVKQSLGEQALAARYGRLEAIAGSLNEAAGWQAIERGAGTTLLHTKDSPSALVERFHEVGAKGDLAVAAVDAQLAALATDDEVQRAVTRWREALATVKTDRDRVRAKSLTPATWVRDATVNISREFELRDAVLRPADERERVLLYNAVLRANLATLAEYVGRERANLGGVIASGQPISPELRSTLLGYRAVVEVAAAQVVGLAGEPGDGRDERGGAAHGRDRGRVGCRGRGAQRAGRAAERVGPGSERARGLS